MSASAVAFYLLGALAIGSALSVILQRHPLTSALSLVVSLCAVAGLYALLDAHFVAAVQVTVYAGAIMVLFVFVIMLLDLGHIPDHPRLRWPRPRVALALLAALAFVAAPLVAFSQRSIALESAGWPPARIDAAGGNARLVAELLFAHYVVAFEVAAMLLLVAMIGTIIMAKRNFVALRPGDAGERRGAPGGDGRSAGRTS